MYSVSEAVRLIGVESHVLRYWEEELGVVVDRSGQGHRIYSEKNVELFRNVKEWKEQGLTLRAIRKLVDGQEEENHGDDENKEWIADVSRFLEERQRSRTKERAKETDEAETVGEPEGVNATEKNVKETDGSETAGDPEGTDEKTESMKKMNGDGTVGELEGIEVMDGKREGTELPMQQFRILLREVFRAVLREEMDRMYVQLREDQKTETEQIVREAIKEEIGRICAPYERMLEETALTGTAKKDSFGWIDRIRSIWRRDIT